MELNQEGAVPQTVESGASTVKATEVVGEESRYKRDMLRYKDETNSLKEEVKELRLVEEQKKGNLEGVINSLKEEIKNLKGSNASQKLNFAETQLNNAIRQQALSRGLDMEKTDVFMRLVDPNDKAVISLDDGFNPDEEEVRSLVDKNMERYSSIGLFTKKVSVADAVPRSGAPAKTAVKQTSDMTSAELKQYILSNKDKLK